MITAILAAATVMCPWPPRVTPAATSASPPCVQAANGVCARLPKLGIDVAECTMYLRDPKTGVPAYYTFRNPHPDFLCIAGRIVDGDTFVCANGPRIRVWGVNAAELKDPGGAEAKRALTRLIAGRSLLCEPKGHSYDRVVALCTVDGRDVAAIMVRSGFAVDWPRYSRGYYRACPSASPRPSGTTTSPGSPPDNGSC